MEILKPDAQADLYEEMSQTKEVEKIITAINDTIRRTPISQRKNIRVVINNYPSSVIMNTVFDQILTAGWSDIEFRCEDRPCGNAYLVLKK